MCDSASFHSTRSSLSVLMRCLFLSVVRILAVYLRLAGPATPRVLFKYAGLCSLQFLGVLASDLRHPSRRLVLQRAQGRLAYATRDEIRLFFSLYVLSRTS